MDQCRFWQPVAEQLRQHRHKTQEEQYDFFLNCFQDFFGPETIAVDSSKYEEPLRVLNNVPDIDVRVIYLIRDVRAWAVSACDASKRNKQAQSSRLWSTNRWRNESMFLLFWKWYIRNRRLRRFIEQSGITYFQLGYDELALQPEAVVPRLCEFLDVAYSKSMLSLFDSGSHSILGNRMKEQPQKRQRIMYDNRWFHRTSWIPAATLLPHIMRYNSEQVYNHGCGVWER